MYKIYLRNKRYSNKVFSTYEQARSYVRKLIRKGKFVHIGSDYDWNDIDYYNPTFSHYGVSIRAEKF